MDYFSRNGDVERTDTKVTEKNCILPATVVRQYDNKDTEVASCRKRKESWDVMNLSSFAESLPNFDHRSSSVGNWDGSSMSSSSVMHRNPKHYVSGDVKGERIETKVMEYIVYGDMVAEGNYAICGTEVALRTKRQEKSDELSLASLALSLPKPDDFCSGVKWDSSAIAKSGLHYHHMHYFLGDLEAQTTDQNVMDQNYIFPLTFLVENGIGNLELLKSQDPKAEFVLSPAYLRSFESEEVNSILHKIEQYRGVYKKKRNPRPTIKRSRHYCLLVKQCSLKRVGKVEKLKQIEKKLGKKKHAGKGSSRPSLLNTTVKQITSQEVQDNNDTSDLVAGVKGKTVLKHDKKHQLTLASVRSLKPGVFLNDEIIDYGLIKVFEMLPPQPTTCFLPVHNWVTYFYRLNHEHLVDRLYKKLLKMEPTLDFLKLKNLVVPVGQDNHWLIAIVCQPFPDEKTVLALEAEANAKGWPFSACGPKLYYKWLKHPMNPPRILIFDSMAEYVSRHSGFSMEAYHGGTAERIANGLLCLHQKLWTETKRGIKVNLDYKKMMVHYTVKVPSQSNREDCGIFVMRYLLMWLKELKKCEGDYMKIYTSNRLHDKYPKYEMIITRKTLCEDILKLCREKSVCVPSLVALIRGFFGQC